MQIGERKRRVSGERVIKDILLLIDFWGKVVPDFHTAMSPLK
jgi:hypothetical protein